MLLGGHLPFPPSPRGDGSQTQGGCKESAPFFTFLLFFFKFISPLLLRWGRERRSLGVLGRNGRSNTEEKKEKLIFGVVGGDSEGKGLGGCARRDGAVAEAPQGLILRPCSTRGSFFGAFPRGPDAQRIPSSSWRAPRVHEKKKKSLGGVWIHPGAWPQQVLETPNLPDPQRACPPREHFPQFGENSFNWCPP